MNPLFDPNAAALPHPIRPMEGRTGDGQLSGSYPVGNYSGGGQLWGGAEPQAEGAGQLNLLAIAWQGRWLILLGLLLGGGVAWALLERAAPLFTSQSQILVESNLPRLLDSDAGLVQSANHLNTQVEIIRSTSVLASVVEQPEIAQLPVIRGADNPIALLREAVTVELGEKNDIIYITAELPDPSDAAQIVNAVVDAYITKYAEERRTDLVDVLNILRNEKVRRDEELADARKQLDDFRREHLALAVQVNDDNVINQRFSMLASELSQAEIDLLQAKARYGRVERMYKSPTQRPFLLDLATANSTHLRDAGLEGQALQVEQQLMSEQSRWGDGYPKVKVLRATLADIEKRLAEQRTKLIDGYVDALRQEYELLEHKRNELQAAYDEQFKLATDVSSQIVTLDSLRDQLARADENCDLIDERIKQLNLTEEVGAMNVSIMEVAQPGWQSYPEPAKFLGAGIVFGGMLGFGLAWLRDLLDHRLRSIEEISDALQLPIVGVLPLMAGERDRRAVGRLVADQPRSTAAEAVRTLRTGLHFGLGGEDVKVMAVTSPSPGDGKSSVASNLAIAISQVERRVLLIDADMRKPVQADIFGVQADVGLSAVLAERRPPAEAIIPSVVGTLDLLPCGKLPSNPVELLNNGYFYEMLRELGETYDKIIIDAPPVMPVADARVISAVCDCTLLVLRAERSTRRLSIAARDELWRVRAQRLGLVVNAVPPRKQAYGYGYGAGYGGYGAPATYGDVAYGYNDRELAQRNGDHTAASEKAERKRLAAGKV